MNEDILGGDVEFFLGDKVIEMAERLRAVGKVAPGACATYGFKLDGVDYRLTLAIRCDPAVTGGSGDRG